MINKNLHKIISTLSNAVANSDQNDDIYVDMHSDCLKVAERLSDQIPRLIRMYDNKLKNLKNYYVNKMKTLSCRFKSSVERMNETIHRQKDQILKVNKKRENERQATNNRFHKSLSRLWESFNRGKDRLYDNMDKMQLMIKEKEKYERNENIQINLKKMKNNDNDSDSSEFEKYLFDQSGQVNINHIRGSMPRDDGGAQKSGYSNIQSKNKTQVLSQFTSKSGKFCKIFKFKF